jgi:hypothetical protein
MNTATMTLITLLLLSMNAQAQESSGSEVGIETGVPGITGSTGSPNAPSNPMGGVTGSTGDEIYGPPEPVPAFLDAIIAGINIGRNIIIVANPSTGTWGFAWAVGSTVTTINGFFHNHPAPGPSEQLGVEAPVGPTGPGGPNY